MVSLSVFNDFSVAFNSLFTSYILVTLLDAEMSKESALWIADSFTRRFFAIIQNDGSLFEWFEFFRGFSQGLRGSGMFYNSASPDIPNNLPAERRSHLFADDKVFELDCAPSELGMGLIKIEECMDGLRRWAQHSGRCFNPRKRQVMIFVRPSFCSSDVNRNLSSLLVIDGEEVEVVQSFEYLGVWLVRSLSWRKQALAATHYGIFF